MLEKYIVELVKEDIDDLVIILDAFVKSQGLSSAERCSQLHKLILEARLAEPDSEESIEEISLDDVEEELKQIIEVPKKKKSSSKRKK